jgi:alcohol dehydrogenase (NADP+)
MLKTKAYAATRAAAALAPFQIQRREPQLHDVLFEILYCGICHSDIHFVHGQFQGLRFPAVPGHEIVGKVTQVGSAVTRHKVGDIVGVGCLVDSCRVCAECEAGEEQFCDSYTPTYGSLEKDGKTPTYGGYSERITVDERFVLKIAPTLSPAAAAPLLCAGITTYSPLRHWKVKKGSRVGVIGLGGLGHIAVKLAAAMGADVTVFSTSEGKAKDAARLGAREFAITRDERTFTRLAASFDLILNTVSATINYDAFIGLLKRDGVLVVLGVPDGPVSFNAFGLLTRRKSVSASPIGSLRETQEMLDFCAQHGIVSDIEMIPITAVNEAYERILKSDVRYRFVIDMASLQERDT